MSFDCKAGVATVITLVSGTVASMTNKLAYQTTASGNGGVVHTFQKACFFTLLMMIGEMMCLFYYYGEQAWMKFVMRDVKNENDTEKLPQLEEERPKPPFYYYIILCLFDIVATTIQSVGTYWVSASAVLMLRGSGVLFTGFCTILIFKRSLSRGQWGGINLVILALCMVGASQVLREHFGSGDSSDGSSLEIFVGIALILVGSLLNSIQGVCEEFLLKGSGHQFRDISPLEVVGWEGLFGTLISAFILLPVAQRIPGSDANSFENTSDTLVMLKNSHILVMYCILYAVSLAMMNNFSQVISKNLNAIARILITTCRVILVWICGLVIYSYDNSLGELWDKWSWLQLAAFIVLVSGTFVYVIESEKVVEHQIEDDIVKKNKALEEVISS